MKWFITGGAGFIGTALAHEVVATGDLAAVFDNFHPQVHPVADPNVPAGSRLYLSDVQDPRALRGALQDFEPDVVVHLAAETGTGQSLTHPSRHVGVNGLGTANLIEGLTTSDLHPRHVVLASSRAVYGEGSYRAPNGETFSGVPRALSNLQQHKFEVYGAEGQTGTFVPHQAETTPTYPSSVYGATKLLQEQLLQSYHSVHPDQSLTILRLQNVYGHGQSPNNPYTGISVLFSQFAAAGKAIPVYEDGDILRDFVHVSDVVTAIVSSVRLRAEGTFDVGVGSPVSVFELASLIAQMHGAPTPRVTQQFRLGDVRNAYADISRTTAVLGFQPVVMLRDGLEELVSGRRA